MIKDAPTGRKVTARQYLKLHPEKYLLTGTADNGITVYVCEPPPSSGLFAVGLTTDARLAIEWSSLDNTPTKQQWHVLKTGVKDLRFVEFIKLDQE